MTKIHSTAIVDTAAQLGTDVAVGPYAVIEAGVAIGDGSVIGPHAVLYAGTRLGRECRVHAGAVLGDRPQDLGFREAPSWVRVGDRCVLREGVTLHRGTQPDSATEIGDDCYLMANAHCAHNVTLGRRVILANGVLLAGYVSVGDGCFMGGNAAVHQFVRVGRLAMVGGLAAVSQDVLPFMTVATGECNVLAGPNTVGLRRAGLAAPERVAIRRAFHLLCRSGLATAAAREQLLVEFPEVPVIAELCAFAAATKRGFCRARAVRASESAAADD